MKDIGMIVICASLLLLGCQSENEKAAPPQAGVNISTEAKSKTAEAARVVEAVKTAESTRAVEAAKTPDVAKAILPEAAGKTATAAGSSPIPAASAGDAINGKRLAKRCKSCHSFKPDGRQMTGPNLFGVYGRTAGKNAAFNKYSSYLRDAAFIWDDVSLAAWVCSSKEAIKTLTGNAAAKTRMPVQKKCGAKGLDIAAYLKSLK